MVACIAEFESPHLDYFHSANLRALVEARGFRLLAAGLLPACTPAGLKSRIDEGASPAGLRWLAWGFLLAAYPALRALPAHTIYHVYRRLD